MGIGLGIILLLAGLILVAGVIDISALDGAVIDANALGWILILVGALAIVLALVMNKQRGETKHVEERRDTGR